MNLAGQRALVAGGTKGMGAAIAHALAAGGATVAVAARHDGDSAAPMLWASASTR
jgi:NAD(P)-dependent dehydrogenase (short-subunit alcohol dehydrogenase family)